MLTIREVAWELAVHPSTVRRLVEVGKLRPVRIGPRLIRYRAADVARLAGASSDEEP